MRICIRDGHGAKFQYLPMSKTQRSSDPTYLKTVLSLILTRPNHGYTKYQFTKVLCNLLTNHQQILCTRKSKHFVNHKVFNCLFTAGDMGCIRLYLLRHTVTTEPTPSTTRNDNDSGCSTANCIFHIFG